MSWEGYPDRSGFPSRLEQFRVVPDAVGPGRHRQPLRLPPNWQLASTPAGHFSTGAYSASAIRSSIGNSAPRTPSETGVSQYDGRVRRIAAGNGAPASFRNSRLGLARQTLDFLEVTFGLTRLVIGRDLLCGPRNRPASRPATQKVEAWHDPVRRQPASTPGNAGRTAEASPSRVPPAAPAAQVAGD